MQRPSDLGRGCPLAARSLRLTRIGNRGTMPVEKERKERREKRKTTQKIAKDLFANQNLLGDQRVMINRRLFAGVKSQKAI